MGADGHIDWQVAASALEWWQDAGVDVLVDDSPRDWLATPIPSAPVPAAIVATPAEAAALASASALPATLEAYRDWRLSDEAPDAGWAPKRLFCEGPEDAPLVVVTDMPCEGGDSVMDGAEARLFDAMLAAIGTNRAQVHLVSLCAAPPLAGRVPPSVREALGEALRHHLGLLRPARLLLLGQVAAQAVFRSDAPDLLGSIQYVNHDSVETRTMAVRHPRFLLTRPESKVGVWRDLQSLMGSDA